MAAELAMITNAQRLRIVNALENIRDVGCATAAAALAALDAVYFARENDSERLALVISQCEQIGRLAQTIARELNA